MKRALVFAIAALFSYQNESAAKAEAGIPSEQEQRSASSNNEALAVCSAVDAAEVDLTPSGFARATAISLWYAKAAAQRGDEIKKVSADNKSTFSWITAMMRISKMATNDFYCAKRSLAPFSTKYPDENVVTVAGFMRVVYDAHISINDRLVELLKNMGKIDQGELMDQISTLQVEREQRWADLAQPISLALISMIDLTRPDASNRATRLRITGKEKRELLGWIAAHFPELQKTDPPAELSEPAKLIKLYYSLFQGRKCSDE